MDLQLLYDLTHFLDTGNKLHSHAIFIKAGTLVELIKEEDYWVTIYHADAGYIEIGRDKLAGTGLMKFSV